MIGETFGNFRVISRIGRGGMGEVYLAEQQDIGTKVAVKVLRADISEDDKHVQRLFNEARAASRIQHAGTVKIFDCGRLPSGEAYLIMEFLDGESLGSRIRRGRLSLAQVCDIGRQIAGILDATHAAGITHRDLKPDNIYLVPDRELASKERVKILDFGIAKLSGTLAAASPGTTGMLGTPAYMAPEQWGDSSKVDTRSDLYSLGCVAFEMCTGRTPFPATTFAEACTQHLHEPPPSAKARDASIPDELDRLLLRLLAKDPADRGTMQDAARVFETIGKTAGSAVAFGPTATTPAYDISKAETVGTRARPQPPTATPRRFPLWEVLLCIVVAGGVVMVIVKVAGRHREPPMIVAKLPVDASIVDALPDASSVDAIDVMSIAEATQLLVHQLADHDTLLNDCLKSEPSRDVEVTVTAQVPRAIRSWTNIDDKPSVAQCLKTVAEGIDGLPKPTAELVQATYKFTHTAKAKKPTIDAPLHRPEENVLDSRTPGADTLVASAKARIPLAAQQLGIGSCITSNAHPKIAVTVTPEGKVAKVRIDDAALSREEKQCLQTKLLKLEIPPPLMAFTVGFTLPFVKRSQ